MQESDSWSKEKSDFSQNLDAFKKGTSDTSAIIKQLDLLLSRNSINNESQLELIDLINAAKLPLEINKLLLNRVTNQKTRFFQSTPPPSTPLENPDNENSTGHSSSILNSLLQYSDSEQDQPIKPGQIIRGTYRLEFKIGNGGMGEVWKALDLIQDAGESRDRYVAIKFINHQIRRHPYALKALVREFARYKKLIHPNIVKAYELNGDGNEVFIAMEYLEGRELKEFIKNHPQGIPLQQAQPIIKAMCDALDYAHNEGIIHLDFKPGNVFFNPDTQVCKVIDFGIARLSNPQERDETLFDPGSLGAMSTAYASSEMLMESEPDIKDDIYGLACVVYELLSGHHPFNKCLSLKAEREHMRPKSIQGLNKDEFQALLHGLSFHRDKRTSSANELYSELFSPQQVASQKRTKWLIIGSIVAASIIVVPFVLYQSYNSWQINQVSTGIEQKSNPAIDDFTALSVDNQQALLDEPSFRLSLVEYITTQHGPSDDILNVIARFSPIIQKRFFADRIVRDTLISYYNNKIDQALTDDNFQLAGELSQHILQQYPDSMRLVDLSDSIEPKKAFRLVNLQQIYQQCLADSTVNLTKLFPCFQQTRILLAKIDNTNALLQLPGLANRYQYEISSAIKKHKLSYADTLLAHWNSLDESEINQRTQLIQQLAYAKKRDELIQQINESDNDELTKILSALPALPSTLAEDVLTHSPVKHRLMTHYRTTISKNIADNNFNLASETISDGISLFSNSSAEQNKLKLLAQKNEQQKAAYLHKQKRFYQQQLLQQEPDINTIQDIQQKVSTIAPDNPLIQLPGLSKRYTKKIDTAISKDQYALAQRLLDGWKTLKPADSNSRIFRQLTDKKMQLSLAFAGKTKAALELQKAITSQQLITINKLINAFKKQFSKLDLKNIIQPYTEQLISVYQHDIDTAIQQDRFDSAQSIVGQMQSILPKNKQVLAMTSRTEEAQKLRIDKLLAESRVAINAAPLNGAAIFSPLQVIQSIDPDYLNSHLDIFKELRKKLTLLTSHEKTLPELKGTLNQWDNFLSSHTQQTDQIQHQYRKSNSLIALRCLFSGRKLKKQNQEKAANELFMFALSLDPINTVKTALEQEILQ